MNNQIWQVSATKGKQPVTLFTCTSDEQVAEDLKQPVKDSLIGRAKPGPFPASLKPEEQNHLDLAYGAFFCDPKYKELPNTLRRAESLPPTGEIEAHVIGNMRVRVFAS